MNNENEVLPAKKQYPKKVAQSARRVPLLHQPIYLDHFGFTHQPFRLTPGIDCFFDGGERGDTLRALSYALHHGDGIVTITGEVGTGKTTLARVMMARASVRLKFIYIANPSVRKVELHRAMADELGLGRLIDQPGVDLLRHIQKRLIAIHTSGQQVVMLIDEAHAMPVETLQEVRLMSNLETSAHKLMQVVLLGQPELDHLLSQPELRPLRERISNRFDVNPLSERDVRLYLALRLRMAGGTAQIFSAEATERIVSSVKGLARRVNVLADKCLLAAYMDGCVTVQEEHVKIALAEVAFQFGMSPPFGTGKSLPGRRWRVLPAKLASYLRGSQSVH